jgi:hypothetical protein
LGVPDITGGPKSFTRFVHSGAATTPLARATLHQAPFSTRYNVAFSV